ncbi:metallophosphoesterase [Neorhizobium galegae]|uniref:metallophosphoesterase n=1 Tax=Neorhizobium galegae TaxID=399 RepID=UPI002100FCF8|nr:metallophosphoesterase [Neorhizobium galegae]MCQ1572708.1 metallophosphoesterase [Neorhizobium galegae]
MKTYAIGDVHGRADLLEKMLSHIEGENVFDPTGYRVIFLGDIIDRGPESKEAMDLVIGELRTRPASRLVLGNHEEFLLLFLDRPDKRDMVFDHWMLNGGAAAAASYGLDVERRYPRIEDAHEMLVHLLLANPAHIEAMRTAAALIREDDYVFVHAGLRPGVAIEKQTTKDLRTIRTDFLRSNCDFGPIVVHGHTVTTSRLPEIYDNRIALDTVAGASSGLSALGIEDDGTRFFLQASAGNKVRIAEPLDLRSDQTRLWSAKSRRRFPEVATSSSAPIH